MSEYDPHDEALCPKCGAGSANHDVCDQCGALISKIRDRGKAAQWDESSSYIQYDESSGSITRKLLIALMVLGVVGFGFFMYKRNSPGGKDSAFVFSTFNSSFDKDVLQHTGGPVVVDFYATWCGPCKMMAPEFEKAAQDNSGIKFMKVDVDNNRELVAKHHVSAMPTTIVYNQGKETGRHVGFLAAPQIKALVDRSVK